MTDSIILTGSRLWQFRNTGGPPFWLPHVLLLCALFAGCGETPTGTAAEAGNGPTDQVVTEADIQTALDAAMQHVQAERLREAAVILDTLVERAPNHPEVRRARGDVMFRLSQISEKGSNQQMVNELRQQAAAEYQAAAEADTENAALWHAAGGMHSSAGNRDEALAAFEKAAELDPSQPQYPLFAAQILIAQGKLNHAEAYVEAALAIDADLPHGWATHAIIELERSNFDIAREHIGRARDLAPDDLSVRAQQARILRRAGDPRAALDLLVPLDPATRYQAAVAHELALSFIAIDDLERAANAWDNAVARDLELLHKAEVVIGLARGYLEAGDRREAARWIRRARQADLSDEQVEQLRSLEQTYAPGNGQPVG